MRPIRYLWQKVVFFCTGSLYTVCIVTHGPLVVNEPRYSSASTVAGFLDRWTWSNSIWIVVDIAFLLVVGLYGASGPAALSTLRNFSGDWLHIQVICRVTMDGLRRGFSYMWKACGPARRDRTRQLIPLSVLTAHMARARPTSRVCCHLVGHARTTWLNRDKTPLAADYGTMVANPSNTERVRPIEYTS